jgi:cystathionine beta-lyase/cystathionine gamma-synthase
MTIPNTKRGPQTVAVHAGEAPDTATGASAPALYMSSTYVLDAPAGFSAHDMSDDTPFTYSRWANPTVAMLEAKLAAFEGAEACLATASGMAAASAIFFTFLSAGDHLVLSDVCYAGVAELARDTLPRMGIEVTRVDMSDPGEIAAAMRPNTRLVHAETPVNPIGRLTDLRAVADIAHTGSALLSVDSTFASPVATRPLAHGADLVLHSLTKYIGGHGDALGGVVAGRAELVKALRIEAGIHHGGTLSPFNAWLIARGAAILPIRMRAHAAGAMAVAEWLEAHPRVPRVIYPGLASHPQHALACRQMDNFSGMIAFQVGNAARGEALARAMVEKLEIIHYAVSLGHHRSLIFWMPTEALLNGPFQLDPRQQESYRAFAGDGIFRLSVGLEDAADLIADLDRVL